MDEKIKEQILAIRATGRTNMFDTNMVQRIADELGYFELVIFIEEHRDKYSELLWSSIFVTLQPNFCYGII